MIVDLTGAYLGEVLDLSLEKTSVNLVIERGFSENVPGVDSNRAILFRMMLFSS